jgi:hypothetical protein
MSLSSRSGVLVIRVWQEDAGAEGLRARITAVSDPQSEDTTALTAAGHDAIVASIRAWLDAFAVDRR